MGRLTWLVLIVVINMVFVAMVNVAYSYDFMSDVPEQSVYEGDVPVFDDSGGSWFSNIVNWFSNSWVGQFFSILNPVSFFNALMSMPIVISGMIVTFYLLIMLYSLITIIRGN